MDKVPSKIIGHRVLLEGNLIGKIYIDAWSTLGNKNNIFNQQKALFLQPQIFSQSLP